MIYTVTFNPSLDYIVSVDDFKLGLTNRTSSELMLPGGKGINVSTVLMNLGIENTALGFTAGFVGKEIIRRLHEMGVKSEFIQISEGVSRINWKSLEKAMYFSWQAAFHLLCRMTCMNRSWQGWMEKV